MNRRSFLLLERCGPSGCVGRQLRLRSVATRCHRDHGSHTRRSHPAQGRMRPLARSEGRRLRHRGRADRRLAHRRRRAEPQRDATIDRRRRTRSSCRASSTRTGTCGRARCATSCPTACSATTSRDILGSCAVVMRPEDVRIGDLVSALGAINAGVTTVLDWSHIGNSPAHTDAAIDGLRASGVRAVYAIRRRRAGRPISIQRTSAACANSTSRPRDQLLTLALAGGMDAKEWAVARDVGASISVHAGGSLAGAREGARPGRHLHPLHHVHRAAWKLVADSGGHISIACPIEMEMGHGVPPIQQALDHGLRPSLSVDVETRCRATSSPRCGRSSRCSGCTRSARQRDRRRGRSRQLLTAARRDRVRHDRRRASQSASSARSAR